MAVQQKVKPKKSKHVCPPHHFNVNSENVGHCKYCPAVRDFGKLLMKQGVLAGRRGTKASKGKSGRKKKEALTSL